MDKACQTCQTCQNRNDNGICVNVASVYFGSRVDDGTCPVWENYESEMWGMNDGVYQQKSCG